MSIQVTYNGDPNEVLDWLQTTIKVDRLSPSGCSGLDESGKFIWRFPLTGQFIERTVLFEDSKVATMFILRWS